MDDDDKKIDDFLESFQRGKGAWDSRLGTKEEMGRRLLFKIETGISKRESSRLLIGRRYWGIAASIVIGLSVAIHLWMITQTPDHVQVITKTTERGQKLNLTLSDNTYVKLNSESRITYPESFTGDTREVELIGEAYFEVTPDKEKPFIVRSGEITTTVLGTRFNVNMLLEKETKVTVAEGSVRVAGAGYDETGNEIQVTLNPNDQAVYSQSTRLLTKQEVDAGRIIAWAEGTMIFEDATLEEIAPVLERWYGVDVFFSNEKVRACAVYTRFQNLSLEEVLDELRLITGVEFDLQRDKVIFSGDGCK